MSIPSPREQFTRKLREIREERRYRQHEVADGIGYSVQYYRHIEAGRKTPPPALGRLVDAFYDIPGGLMEDLCEEARRDVPPLVELIEGEEAATHIRVWESRFVPGLLQTEDYARAILQDEDAVSRRIARQRIFDRGSPVEFHAVIDEGVLWRPTRALPLFRRQLERLFTISCRVQVLPFSAGIHVGLDGQQTILDFEDQPTQIWYEMQGPARMADTAQARLRATEVWETVLGLALSPALSEDMIRAVADEYPEEE